MAKDDYFVIVYKVLLYLYACFKRKTVFDTQVFLKSIKVEVSEAYFDDILKMMQTEGYIEGFKYKKAWGGDVIRISEYEELEITQKGIEFLEDNSKMRKVKGFLLESVDIVAKLINIVGV